MRDSKATNIDGYLSPLPDLARATLEELRRRINALVPDAVESISYGMPTFKYKGRPLVYFAAAKTHCAVYGTSRGTWRFPPGEPPSAASLKPLLDARIAAIETAAAKPKLRKSGATRSG